MKNTIFVLHDETPKYKQIYAQFKTWIECGDLRANEPLPSIRQLADSLHVSRNTTLTAYEQLVAEGYIRAAGRSGYFVNALEPNLFQHVTSPPFAPSTTATPPLVVDFRAGAVDQSHFPLNIWRRMANEVLTAAESYRYGHPFGELCLREQIARYLLQSRGVKTQADAIIIGSSTQQMLLYIAKLLKEQFPSIIIEDPGYDGAKEAFQFHDFALETIRIEDTGADFSTLPIMASRIMYITPSHQSPTGISMPIQQRQMLLQWAHEKEGYIIEDDYDSEFRYTQQPFPALASIDATRVIYVGNFSKSFLPGIRLSYMVLPQLLLERYKRQFSRFESTASLHHQLTMATFMASGEWDRHIKRMRLVYKRKMQCLVSQLRQQFGQTISIIGEQSGLYVLLKVHTTHSEQWLIEQALVHGVRVYPTSVYFIHESYDAPLIKLGFSNLTCEDIEKGVILLKKAWGM